jgi:hypothetical protein
MHYALAYIFIIVFHFDNHRVIKSAAGLLHSIVELLHLLPSYHPAVAYSMLLRDNFMFAVVIPPFSCQHAF